MMPGFHTYAVARTKPLAGRVRTAVVVAVLAFAQSACQSTVDRSDLIERGKSEFEDLRFHDAKATFAEVLAENGEHAEGAYAYARVASLLNEFEEAIASFERALALNPDDPRSHEGYLHSLYWAGYLRGRRERLDQAVQSGVRALRKFPDLALLYDLSERSLKELNEQDGWPQILASLEPEIGSSSVFRIRYLGARLAAAKSRADSGTVATIETELRTLLDAGSRIEASGEPIVDGLDDQTVARNYQLAYGYGLLGEEKKQREFLLRLEDAGGLHLAAEMSHFRSFFPDYFGAESVESRLDILERWQQRFPLKWDNEDLIKHHVPMALRLVVLRSELRRRAAAPSGEPQGASSVLDSVSDADLVDQVFRLAERLGPLDTGAVAARLRAAAQDLQTLDIGAMPALTLADSALARLQNGDMLHPATAPHELESTRDRWVASFEHVRGLALHRLGDSDGAEAALRTAVSTSPDPSRLLALGEFLVAEGRHAEAYDALIDALGWNAEVGGINDEASVREAARRSRAWMGSSETEIEDDIAEAHRRAALKRRRSLTGARLDSPAPDFQLTDSHGTGWRLADLSGKVVVLNYWAAWCANCQAELPHWAVLVDDYSEVDDIVFLAINLDSDRNSAESYLAQQGFAFTVLFDQGSSTDYQILGVPEHVFIGQEGNIQFRASGFSDAERYAFEMKLRIEELRLSELTTQP